MASFIIDTDVESDERYDLEKLVKWDTDMFDILDSTFLSMIKKLPTYGYILITTEERNPPLISYKIYGTVMFWNIILHYNNILDVDDIVTGTRINYPSISDIENVYFRLNGIKKSRARR